MDINQVKFGNFSIANSNIGSGAKSESKKDAPATVGSEAKAVNPDAMLDALNIVGLQNKIQINSVARKEINPTDYLSEERIKDIEAMMMGFENGVNQAADAIDAEFPGLFADDAKYALAAKVVAQG